MTDQMPVAAEMAQMWTLLADRKGVRLQLPRLPIDGLPEDAESR